MDRPQKNLPADVANIMPMPGHVFEGKYRIVNLIGAGGFARVFHARFEDVARDVALKVLLPTSADPATMYGEELVQRFLREARAVSELRSPNTITLHDFGRTRSGLLYMIFEYVDGEPLDRLIKKLGPMPAERVVPIVRQVLASLREAHTVGMLHRDIKPANVMVFDYLDQRDVVKLLDFGIAKTWTHDVGGNPILDDLTEDGTVMGTPRYMSPEQIVGQRLTPQSDIYAVGLLAYEMLSGVPAAAATQKTDVVRRHLGPEPFVLAPELAVPPKLAGIVGGMLSKDITQRFQSVEQVSSALAEFEATYEPDMARTQASSRPHLNTAPAPVVGSPAATSAEEIPVLPVNGAWGTTPVAPQGAMEKPKNTFIQVRATPLSFEVDVPLKPNKRALIICAATFVPFFIAFTVLGIFATLITGVAFAWGLSLVFTTHRLRISTQEGYEVITAVFTYERAKRGSVASIVRFEARGRDEDDDTVLKLITHEGEFTVANAFSEAETQWLAGEGNAWIAQLRAAQPQPLG